MTHTKEMSMNASASRESIPETPNPLGLAGIEFIEYATTKPQALGQVLENMGFQPIARHRSREVLLYRQGDINIIVNAHSASGRIQPEDRPVITAVALRVRDARAAFRHVLERGAWAVPTRVEVMELNIPAIHGVGGSHIYFVDRHEEFSIYDVDFIPIPGAQRHPAALKGLHLFGIVQYTGVDRTEDWTEFYGQLFSFQVLPDEERFGILPKGRILRSACGTFYLQLVEPVSPDVSDTEELLHRIALGAPDVPDTVKALQTRGISFVDAPDGHPARGALTRAYLGGLVFELVQHAQRPGA